MLLRPLLLVELAQTDGGRDASAERSRRRVLFVFVVSADGDDHVLKVLAQNLEHSIDFRSVYASVLDRWLGVSSKEVLGVEYPALELFA